MNKKIAIIGGGLFGTTLYILLKRKGYNCILFEKNKDLLLGASTNNLNRVHFGYHYPRDTQTAKQSYKGYISFKNFFKKSIIKNFRNFYFISNSSKVNFKNYLKFCKKNKLPFKKFNINKEKISIKNIQGGIEVKEPIYDWNLIKKETKNLIKKLRNNKIKLNERITKIIKAKKGYTLISNKKTYNYDIIFDASYEQSNFLIKNLKSIKKNKYQLVVVFEFIPKNFKKMGLAIMDGKYFSFLPKGKQNKHLFYHVKHSILFEKVCYQFPRNWLLKKRYKALVSKNRKLILKDFKKYLPGLKIKFTSKNFINPRLLPKNVEKSDRRISSINEISKNYFQIFSAKVDHSVDIANKVLKKIDLKK